MDVATGAMGSLLPKLTELLEDEYELQKGVKKDVMSLSREMESMSVALHKVAEVPRRQVSEQVILWASEVRELSYKMEDVVDTFLVCADSPDAITNSNKLRQFMERMINLFRKGKTRHDFSDAIKDMKYQMKDVIARRDKYKVESLGGIVANPATATSAIDPRLLVLYKNQKELVGIEEARDELIKRLTDGNDDTFRQQLKFFSVFGFGGLGKTTLAKVVYDRLQAQFDCGAFVLVGRTPDMQKVFMDILRQLDKQKYMALNAKTLQELITIIRILLRDKRYIIVIDDIWHQQELDIIKCSLVDSNYGSRVIITTRTYSVAQLATDVYKLKPLSCDNSERLLYTILFSAKGKCPNGQAGGVCRNILEKCEGVPSTILTIASLLASKSREDWLKVYNSIDFGYGDSEDIDNMRNIRLFSYYDLPSYLRTCLLYLCTFPKGKLIRKDTLIWKWVAEGFVRENRRRTLTLFEVGEMYFNELINRSMIEPVEIMYGGVIIGCRVYGSVLDIISSLSKEENFVTVFDSSKHHISSQSNARRLAVQNRVVEQHNSLVNMHSAQMRSFHATMCCISAMPSLSSFQVLRVLAIEDCTFMEGRTYQLEHLGKLLHLRYLGLLNMPIRELPKEIGNLKFLQILDLRDTEIKILPRAVVLLRRLMCLRAEGGSITVPDGIGNLRSLEELRLNNVSRSPKFLEELRELTELRVLEIWIEGFDGSSIKALVESLGNLCRIQVLKLMGGLSSEEVNFDCFVPPPNLFHLHLAMECPGLPPWIHPSVVPLLSHLWVVVKAVQVQDVEILGKLPELVSLTLLIPTVVNISLDITGGGAFPKLRHCYISAPLRFLHGAMPSLESLKFEFKVLALKDTDFFDDFGGLGNLPSLQKVMIKMDCLGASAMEVEAAEAAVKYAVDIHPNSPIIEFIKGQQTDGNQEKEQEATVL